MFRMHLAANAILALGALAGCATPPQGQPATAYEGARLIVGDGRVIENGTLVVEGARIAQSGAAASVQVPAGATRVNLAGKTVIDRKSTRLNSSHVALSRMR